MTFLTRYIAVFAALFLAAPLFGQTRETGATEVATPAPIRAALGTEVESVDNACSVDHLEILDFLLHVPTRRTPCQAVFVFGGAFSTRAMGRTSDVFNVEYDGNHLGAVGYQRYHWEWQQFALGWEIGAAQRLGDVDSVEFWGGATLRHPGVTLVQLLTISPSFTAGFSTVTDAMGTELRRQETRGGDATFLFYLGPEINVSTTLFPNVELFWRLHHRCGGKGTLGDLSEGYNANVAGLRFRF